MRVTIADAIGNTSAEDDGRPDLTLIGHLEGLLQDGDSALSASGIHITVEL